MLSPWFSDGWITLASAGRRRLEAERRARPRESGSRDRRRAVGAPVLGWHRVCAARSVSYATRTRCEPDRRNVAASASTSRTSLGRALARARHRQQILINLLLNAVDSPRAADHPSVAAQRTKPLRLSRADDGLGIPQDQARQLFCVGPLASARRRWHRPPIRRPAESHGAASHSSTAESAPVSSCACRVGDAPCDALTKSTAPNGSMACASRCSKRPRQLMGSLLR